MRVGDYIRFQDPSGKSSFPRDYGIIDEITPNTVYVDFFEKLTVEETTEPFNLDDFGVTLFELTPLEMMKVIKYER